MDENVKKYSFNLIRSMTNDRLELLVKLKQQSSKIKSFLRLKEIAKLYYSRDEREDITRFCNSNLLDFIKKNFLFYEFPKLKKPKESFLIPSPILRWILDKWDISDQYALPTYEPLDQGLSEVIKDVVKALEKKNEEYLEKYIKSAAIRHELIKTYSEKGIKFSEIEFDFKITERSQWGKPAYHGYQVSVKIEIDPKSSNPKIDEKDFERELRTALIYTLKTIASESLSDPKDDYELERFKERIEKGNFSIKFEPLRISATFKLSRYDGVEVEKL